ncbi:hypothetical protein O6R08_00880 [Cutibacterium equinum]|uniref:Uncharacterized protein n=1 Tax=Cutibacterium equinum TaxID=3016342 RepID=A0ABY7R242_9ACTN|nr:hypothetical protein [Cutibacterium equinum]WCC80959.1 hypothetical protein O6R08_00880 [Cutibacterium equinum]
MPGRRAVMNDQRRIVTTDRAGSIWAGITWCSLLLFIVAGIAGMMAQTMLPANLGYPQLHDTGVPAWLTWTVVAVDIIAFLIPAVVCTSCGRKAKRLGHPVRSAVQIAWATFAVVTVISLLLVLFG